MCCINQQDTEEPLRGKVASTWTGEFTPRIEELNVSLSLIDFGKATGEQEGIDSPILIKNGFLDKGGIVESIVNGGKSLVLGFKGSGKSTIGEKIRLGCYPAVSDSKVCAVVNHLADFPFKSFSKICPGAAEPEAKYPTSWQYLLMTTLLQSFLNDPRGRDTENLEFRESVSKLTEAGMLPVKSLKHMALKASKSSFKLSLAKILEYSQESSDKSVDQDLMFLDLVDLIKEIIPEFSTQSTHLIVLDGLDDVLTSRDIQLNALSALIFEANRLNIWLKKEGVRAKIVVLCRTDLFERLPIPNKNKIKQDSAVLLDWYHDPQEPQKSQLAKLANLRAGLALNREVDIFSEFFHAKIEDRPSAQFLLEHTRHTPRDFIQLLNNIKEFDSGGKLNRSEVVKGIRKYSIDYFLPEVEDEIVGYADHDVFLRFKAAVTKIKAREFEYSKLYANFEADGSCAEKELSWLLKVLFKCSAIGNKWAVGGSIRYEFVYRNPHADFDRDKVIVLHKGLWKSLNLI